MSDPSTGHEPEQGPEESQPEQPTRPIGPPEHPTTPIGSTGPLGVPAEEAPPMAPENHGMPLGTFVFGLVVMAIGLLILVSVFYNITLSGSTVAIILFLGAGLVLIGGGLVAARRSSRTHPTRS
ncbi:hypothetical protein ACTXOR_03120 [Arthrobacter rhombi]|uniref:Uncharacterized protein n=1 Tax=Arthrobacter rhombi TaxID=71253 RepID=A0A1R4GSC7_9MICC|nr:TIGR04086 family membrane protein [Arthrobacter rhombi]SJM71014.1 hypothetical protein FM101_12890 [Arthrobacter rhombi]